MKDKPKSMTPKTQKRSVVFSTETLEQIEKLAIKKNVFERIDDARHVRGFGLSRA